MIPGRPRRILLVGFMAAGKSTVGRLVAERLGWELVDVDREVERRSGRSVPELLRTLGEAEFRTLEAAVAGDALRREGVVVAPGGGWGMAGRPVDVPEETLYVWLRISPEEAVRRAGGEAAGVDRPLLAARDPLARARRLLARREPRYRRAALWLDTEGRDPRSLADVIVAAVGKAAGTGAESGPAGPGSPRNP